MSPFARNDKEFIYSNQNEYSISLPSQYKSKRENQKKLDKHY
jgi:hypothetical protein